MICVTKLNGQQFYLNCDHIEKMDAHPDTTITLTNSHVYIVKETLEEVLQKIRDYRRDVFNLKYNAHGE